MSDKRRKKPFKKLLLFLLLILFISITAYYILYREQIRAKLKLPGSETPLNVSSVEAQALLSRLEAQQLELTKLYEELNITRAATKELQRGQRASTWKPVIIILLIGVALFTAYMVLKRRKPNRKLLPGGIDLRKAELLAKEYMMNEGFKPLRFRIDVIDKLKDSNNLIYLFEGCKNPYPKNWAGSTPKDWECFSLAMVNGDYDKRFIPFPHTNLESAKKILHDKDLKNQSILKGAEHEDLLTKLKEFGGMKRGIEELKDLLGAGES